MCECFWLSVIMTGVLLSQICPGKPNIGQICYMVHCPTPNAPKNTTLCPFPPSMSSWALGMKQPLDTPASPQKYLVISVVRVQVFQGLRYQVMGNVAIELGQLPGGLQVKLRSKLGFRHCLFFGLLFLFLDGNPLLYCSQRVRSEGAEIPLIWEDHWVAPVIHLHPCDGDKLKILRELSGGRNHAACPGF